MSTPDSDETLYRSLVASSPTGLFVSGLDGTFLLANQAVAAMAGHASVDEFLKLRAQTLWADPADREGLLQELREQGVVRNRLLRSVRKNGEQYWISLTATLVRDDQGHPTAILGSVEDITERKQAEDSLQESKASLAATLNALPDLLFEVDAEGRLLDFRAPNPEMLYRPSSEFLGLRVGDVLPPDAAETITKTITCARLRERCVGNVYSLEMPGGTEWYELSAAAKADGRIVVLARDISARKRSEAELRASQGLLRSIVDGISDVVYAKDAAGRYCLVNAAAARYTGSSALSVLGQDDTVLMPAAEATAVMATDRAIMAEGATRTYEETLTLGSEPVTFLTTKGPLRDAEGAVIGLFGIAHDITERKRANQEKLELERRLLHAQKLESLGVLAGGVAHDFNNLLMAIVGHLDVARLDAPPAAPVRSDIDAALEAAHRASELTRQLLAYSGRGRFVVAPLDLGAMVHECTDLLRTAILRSSRLEVALAPAWVCADRGQMQQVVMNLLTNASEALGDAGGVISLRTGVEEWDDERLRRSRSAGPVAPGSFAYLEVTDTGCGMDEATQERLFDPFFSTKFTGRGLGMSGVLGIVRGHQGAILVDSEPGRGTSVRVLFPAIPAGAAPPRADPHPAAAFTGSVRMILVVDDEDAVRLASLRIARRLGFEGLGAASGDEALVLLERYADEIACVILDLTMPGKDGVATFEAIRRLRPDIRVILVSGYDETDVALRFTGARPDGFLQKPFRFEQLRSKLAGLIPPSA